MVNEKKNSQKIITDYDKLLNSFGKRIEEKGLKHSYVMKELGITSATYYKRIADPSQFSKREVEIILNILNL